MSFALPDHWVWDSWIADDGREFHLFYLHAPKSLRDPGLRHRNARIGHATSTDLRTWTDHGAVLDAGLEADHDSDATWTGSVTRGPDGVWRMFYTGARFTSPDSGENRETVLLATSTDLRSWTKATGFAVAADPVWYETLPDRTWREEAWRDPWVVADPRGDGWHMLITARARDAVGDDRGVIGHAVSPDLITWTTAPPLTAPGAGFAHLEVPQTLTIDGHEFIVFSCDTAHLAGRRAGRETGGIWAIRGAIGDELDAAAAELVADEAIYAGRVVRDRDGSWVLIGFEYGGERDDEFIGQISDPIPLEVTADGRLSTRVPEATR